jgi:hypothetical protein
MTEVINILLANIKRIKDAECFGDTTIAKLETEAFQATLAAFHKKGRLSAAEYNVMNQYLVEFSAEFGM